ncbi:hypothetical protein ABZ621_07535 [Streptomyces sp. NPDC007863]|uniref:hypothetical protein n=1 Tax=Streptomyces sp. NPDC007863 TaxID=3154894 RepID=UPI0033CB1D1B
MDLFVCAGCGAELSVPVERVALPAEAHCDAGHRWMPPLMEPGTYAVDPDPWGRPWRTWEEIGASGAAAHGVYAPAYGIPTGPRNVIVLAPGDTRGTRLLPERSGNSCLGMVAGDEPSLLCAGCGLGVGFREDDCGVWQTVRYAPGAVVRRSLGVPPPAAPVLPLPPVDLEGDWDLRWSAAAGAALARLLAASGGRALCLPDGLPAVMFGRTVERLLPAGPPFLTVGVAGPGLPGTGADIVLVPSDRRTGEPWRPAGDAVPVPLPAPVWARLARSGETSPTPVSGTLPTQVVRDDYPHPDRPGYLFRPDRRTLRGTLARMPEVRQPWLRALYDRL